MAKQLNIFDYHQTASTRRKYGRTTHGGVETKGRRKEQRPLARGKWTHLVLKSAKAKGQWSFLAPKNRIWIQALLKTKAKKWGVQIADFANVGNHLHIKCKFSDKKNFQKFLISITCLIARHVTKASRTNKIPGGFWQGLAFTRVLKTSFEEMQLKGYFKANRLEAEKGHPARQEFLDKFNRWVHRLRDLDRSGRRKLELNIS